MFLRDRDNIQNKWIPSTTSFINNHQEYVGFSKLLPFSLWLNINICCQPSIFCPSNRSNVHFLKFFFPLCCKITKKEVEHSYIFNCNREQRGNRNKTSLPYLVRPIFSSPFWQERQEIDLCFRVGTILSPFKSKKTF